MRNSLHLCRSLLFSLLVVMFPVSAWPGGLSDKFSDNPEIQNAIDTVEAEVESLATKGEATRGPSGPMIQLLQSSDTLICSSWIIAFRQELQRLSLNYLDPPYALLRAAQDLLSRVERACQEVLNPGTAVRTPPTGETSPPPTTTEPPAGQPFTPRPGWTITDEICARRCSAESAAVQRTDWRKYDAETAEKNVRAQLTKDERELASERENLARAEARLESARANLARREEFARRLPPSADGRSNTDLDLSNARVAADNAKRELPQARSRVAAKEAAAAASRSALNRATAARARADQEAALARAALDRCLRDCYRQAPQQEDKVAKREDKLTEKSKVISTVGGGCSFPPARPVTIGPREKFGYGEEQKSAEVGKAALGFLGGLVGFGGGGGGGMSPAGGDKPQLADDPVKNKQTFTDAQSGTAIKVGGQYRPDGKLLVSVDVDEAADKGVVHQASLERLQKLPGGGCKTQVAEPVEWQHYEIWEDWWAKIRIQRFESVDGGPWRQTHDTGWRDWGSGSRLLDSGTLPADQIPRTAWGSMGADRAFGGPRSAGAVFDTGKPLVVGTPAPERLVVHVTQPGKDPVTTVPFTLYPTYATDGKVSYTDKAPDLSALQAR
jgi:hypothetical protein